MRGALVMVGLLLLGCSGCFIGCPPRAEVQQPDELRAPQPELLAALDAARFGGLPAPIAALTLSGPGGPGAPLGWDGALRCVDGRRRARADIWLRVSGGLVTAELGWTDLDAELAATLIVARIHRVLGAKGIDGASRVDGASRLTTR